MLLCCHAARESSKGAGVGLPTQEGIQPICLDGYLSFLCILLLLFVSGISRICLWINEGEDCEGNGDPDHTEKSKNAQHLPVMELILRGFMWCLCSKNMCVFICFLAAGQAGERSRY